MAAREERKKIKESEIEALTIMERNGYTEEEIQKVMRRTKGYITRLRKERATNK